MRALTAEQIRAGFVNLGAEEAARVPMPGLHEVLWEDREFLGWRDPSLAGRGYLAIETADAVVAIAVRRAQTPLARAVPAMCSLCHSTQPFAQVALFSAARAGQAGRDGATVGTYICDDLGCSHTIRMLPASSPGAVGSGDLLARRSAGLITRVLGFTASVTKPIG